MYALVLIDQQQGIDEPKLGARNNASAASVMLKLLAVWRERGWPIIHVKHRSTESDSVFWPEQTGFEFKAEFEPLAGEIVVEKSVPCAFINNTLADQLNEVNARNIVIVGAATNNSVEATARTGGNLGFSVYVVEDACFAFEKHDFDGVYRSAQEVHAMSLANLNGEYAQVLKSDEILAKVAAQ